MSLQPDRQNLVIWKGGTFEHRFTWLTGGEGSAPRDLTGYTAAATILDAPGGTSLLSLTTANAGIALGQTAGTIDLTIASTATSILTWTTGVYDLILTDALLTSYVLVFGSIVVKGL